MEGYGSSPKELNAWSCSIENLEIKREIYTAANLKKYLELYDKDRWKLPWMEFILLQCYNTKPSPIPWRFLGKDRSRPKQILHKIISENNNSPRIHNLISPKYDNILKLVAPPLFSLILIHLYRRLPLPYRINNEYLPYLQAASKRMIFIKLPFIT